jgi:hypothetical protein
LPPCIDERSVRTPSRPSSSASRRPGSPSGPRSRRHRGEDLHALQQRVAGARVVHGGADGLGHQRGRLGRPVVAGPAHDLAEADEHGSTRNGEGHGGRTLPAEGRGPAHARRGARPRRGRRAGGRGSGLGVRPARFPDCPPWRAAAGARRGRRGSRAARPRRAAVPAGRETASTSSRGWRTCATSWSSASACSSPRDLVAQAATLARPVVGRRR